MAPVLELPIFLKSGRQRVYVKSSWSANWAQVPGLWASDLAWSALPRIGAARLQWRAFKGTLAHETQYTYHGFQSLDMRFVKVEYTMPAVTRFNGISQPAGTIRWIGFIDRDQQNREDVVRFNSLKKATGGQSLAATSIDQVFDDTILLTGYFKDQSTASGQLRTFAEKIGRAPIFNEDRKPNRSDTKVGGSYVFSKYSQNASYWSTQDIVEYLFEWHYPRTGTEAPLFPGGITNVFGDPNLSPLFGWDKPEVSAHGRSVKSVLCELLNIQRGLGAYFVAPDDPNQPMLFTPFTHAIAPVVLSSENINQKLLANPFQFNLAMDYNSGRLRDGRPDIVSLVSRNMESKYDRVVAQGAPRRTCFSVNFNADATLKEDWTLTEEGAYDSAASSSTGYAGLTATEKKTRNNSYRENKYGHVYKRFKLPDDFNGKAKGGDGGAEMPVFDTPATELGGYQSNWPLGWRFSRTLPLFEGEDYTAAEPRQWPYQSTTKAEPMPLAPLVFLPQGSNKYLRGDIHGIAPATANKSFSLHVRVQEFPPRLILDTHNALQHAIAKNHWTPLSGANETAADAIYDWEDFIITLCLEESRLAEAVWPEQPFPPLVGAEIPVLRTKYLRCGEQYRLDWLAGRTVVGIDDKQELLRSVSSGNYVRDDRNFLTQIARAAYDFFRRPRVAATFQKTGATASLWLGTLLEQLGRAEDPPEATLQLNTVVTETTIHFPISRRGRPGPPIQTWTTSASELDALEFLL